MRLFDAQIEPVHSRAAVERAISQYELLSPDPFIIHRAVHKNGAVVDFSFEFCNPAAAQLFGRPLRELRGASLLKSFPHVAHDPRGFDRYVFILETGEYDETDVPHPLGVPQWTLRRRLTGLFDDRIAISYRDTREEVRSREQLQLRLRAVQHRLRSQFALVQAICNHTLEAVGSLNEFSCCFPQRMAALAGIEGLALERSGPTRIADLIERALAPFDFCPRSLEGDAGIAIPAAARLPLTLALHELGTNAVRQGIWSQPGGQIDLCWQTDGPALHLEWSEPVCGQHALSDIARDCSLVLVETAITSLAKGKFEVRHDKGRIRHLMEFDAAAAD